jgi:hypothetical protein
MTTQELVLETLAWLKHIYAGETPDVKERIVNAIETIVSQTIADDLFKDSEDQHE